MSIRVLVVDDNREILKSYVTFLLRRIRPKNLDRDLSGRQTELFLEVYEADTFSLAMKKLKENPCEILVVDLKIPGPSGEEMGGLEIIDASIKLDPLRPIIVITGYGTVELARRTLTKGVFDFIEKSSTAVDDLVDAVQRAINSRDEKIKRVGNPFMPMTGVEPTVFGGRTEELEFFDQRLNRAIGGRIYEHFLVLGDWGIGKSTLSKEYKKICQSRGNIATVVPLDVLQPGTKVIEAVRSVVEGIFRDLPFPVARFKKVIEYFDSIGGTILGTGIQLSRDTSKQIVSPQAFLHDTLRRLWQDLQDKTEIIVVILDDLDNFMAVPEFMMTLKTTLSMDSILKKTKILFGITSNPKNWLDLTSTKKHHPLSRYFLKRVVLEPLTANELKETIIKTLSGTGLSFSTNVIEQVFRYTKGHPFEMQVLCYHLFNNQLSRRVEIDVWEKALQGALNDMGSAIFDYLFNQASSNEVKVLNVIAESENPVSVKQIQELAERGELKVTPRNIAKYIQRLVEKGLIKKSRRGSYDIEDRMFRAYIRTRSD